MISDGFQSAFNRILEPQIPDITILSFLIMIATMGINIVTSIYENQKGREIGSTILISDALHTRSDIYVSSAVIVGFVAVNSGFTIMDPLISIFIAF